MISPDVWIAAGAFLVTYALIVTDRLHRTLSALAGGLVVIILGAMPQEAAFEAIDWNVIFLLAGMMVIANVISETGLFPWIGVQAVKLGDGDPRRILAILAVVTAVASALLDNVTVIVLLAPVTLFVAASLGVSPVPFLIAMVLASNIGGMATLIGDPPNILIGSAANIDFLTFTRHLTPLTVIILVVFILMAPWLFKKDLQPRMGRSIDVDSLDASALITNYPLLRKSLIVMLGVMVGFTLHGALHLEPATIALAGATVLMIWTGQDPHRLLRNVEWPTLFFFMGLFIVVEAVVRAGIIDSLAAWVLRMTGGSLTLTTMLLLWLSALGSGVIDNIPYTATMIPIVKQVGQGMPIEPLWWALAMGACLGGNLTLVGASANVIAASLSERSGHPIHFGQFLRYGLLVTLMSLGIATVYLWVRYL